MITSTIELNAVCAVMGEDASKAAAKIRSHADAHMRALNDLRAAGWSESAAAELLEISATTPVIVTDKGLMTRGAPRS